MSEPPPIKFVPDSMPPIEANRLYGERYGIDWMYSGRSEQAQGQQYADKLGERTLDASELHLINKIKAHGPVLEQLLTDVDTLLAQRLVRAESAEEKVKADGQYQEAKRALALGKTNLQQGYMWLVRAASAPNGLV